MDGGVDSGGGSGGGDFEVDDFVLKPVYPKLVSSRAGGAGEPGLSQELTIL